MFSFTSRHFVVVSMAMLAALAIGSGARAQNAFEGDIHQSVARISYLSGDVSYSRGDEADVWQDAAVNVPMTIGDRVYTGSGGRAELQVEGAFIRMSTQSDLSALNLTDDIRQFSLQSGIASFDIRRLGPQDSFEVDTPNVAVTFERPGQYRVDVDQDGNSRVSVRTGSALVAAGGGQVPLSAGSVMEVSGVDSPQYDIVSLSAPDAWDRWVDSRRRRFRSTPYSSYVNAGVVGREDLDQYGRWSDIPQYGHCWSPSSVSAGWQPYQAGHWGWQDPWGWTWISVEPWGWAPYHYGRWVTYSSRWFWVPVAPSVSFVAYAPALVAFVGGGPGWSASFSIGGGGYVGWFPLGPRDPYNPWWGSRAGANLGVTNVTYVNRNYVTVVNQNTFISGGVVSRNQVRDVSVLRQVSAAPVIRGAVPVLPTAAALRVSSGATRAAARPPVAQVSRPVVTRLAPAPAPPSFQSKVAAIRENRGAPVTPAAAARMSVQSPQGARAAVPIRPAAAAPGNVTFTPRNKTAPRPQVITAPVGRAPARTIQTPPERREPLAPREEKAVPAEPRAQTGGQPPARTIQTPPERRQPLAPREEKAVPAEPRAQTGGQPPARTIQTPPERRAAPPDRQAPQRTPVPTVAPSNPRSAAPSERKTPPKKPDNRKKEAKPASSSEPPPKTE